MKSRFASGCVFAMFVLTVSASASAGLAQTPTQIATAVTPDAGYADGQLDQILAPMALYPDTLLAQVLMASTYPLELVQAHRWLLDSHHASLKGAALAQELQAQPWDPSVKALVPFPQVLQMLDGNISWTEEMGNAFLADQGRVMASVQRLRQRARATGHLTSQAQDVVAVQDQAITIVPADPAVVYVPVYNPTLVYGAWPYPEFPPYYFPGYFAGVTIGMFGIAWFAMVTEFPFWGWEYMDWGHRSIHIDGPRFSAINGRHANQVSGAWQHNPAHRGGVPYRTARETAHYNGVHGPTAQTRALRGYTSAAHPTRQSRVATPSRMSAPVAAGSGFRANLNSPVVAPSRSSHMASTPPALESFGPASEVRAQAQRGRNSRQSTPSSHGIGGGRASASPSFGHGRRGR